MKREIVFAVLILCGLSTMAEARQRHRQVIAAVHPMCNIIMPCELPSMSTPQVRREVRPHARREARRHHVAPVRTVRAPTARDYTANNHDASPFGPNGAIGRPLRFIAGRLICAINVNSALAERGIKGTGSALAHSFDRWGHASPPVPGAVAVSDRRGGGHVAIVSRVAGSRVFVWNATGGHRGWSEIEYTHKHARYRVAG